MDYSLEDYYNTGDNSVVWQYGAYWDSQTFQTGSAYAISRVKIKCFRTGSPGTVTVGLRATTAGKPSGVDLTSGTFDGNSITSSSPGEWVAVDFTPYELSITTTYAIVVRAPSGSASHRLNWRRDSGAGYAGGSRVYSLNSGSSWSIDAANDFMFETYSGSAADYKDMSGTATMTFHTFAGPLTVSSNITNAVPSSLSKLVAIGNDSFYYES